MLFEYEFTCMLVRHWGDVLDITWSVKLVRDVRGYLDVGAVGYEEWEAERRPRNAGNTAARKDESSPPPPKQQTKLSYKDQRDYELLPRRVEELEAQIVRDEQALSDPDLYVKEPERFAALRDRKSVV